MDLPTRAAVRAEELAILLPALAHDPWRQVTAVLANGVMQLGQLGLDDLVLGRGAAVTPDDYTFVYQPLGTGSGLGGGRVQRRDLPDRGRGPGRAARLAGPARAPIGDPVLACVLLVLAALILNAAICGALSGVHPRYQSRVVWLLPLLAAGLLARPAAAVTAARGAPAPPAPDLRELAAQGGQPQPSRRRNCPLGRGRLGAVAARPWPTSPEPASRRSRFGCGGCAAASARP